MNDNFNDYKGLNEFMNEYDEKEIKKIIENLKESELFDKEQEMWD